MSIINESLMTRLLWMLIIGTTPVSTTGHQVHQPTISTTAVQATPSSFLTPKRDVLLGGVSVPDSLPIPAYLLGGGGTSPALDAIGGQIETTERILRKRDEGSSLTYYSKMLRRVQETSNKNKALSELIKLFFESSTGRNIFIFYNPHLYPDSSEALGVCFKFMAEVTILKCDEAMGQIEKIIKSYNVLESLRNIIVLCSSSQTLQIFQQIHEKYLESASTHWFLVILEDITRDILALMREGTQVSFAEKEYDFSYQMSVSYIDVMNEVALSPIGRWSWDVENGTSNSLTAPLVRSLDEVYGNFGGRQLKATFIDNWPFWVFEYLEDGSIKPTSGLDFRVLTDISEILNFTFQMSLTPDNVWGGVMPDGTVTGMVGAVHYHTVHLAINELTLTEKREQAVDFTKPYFHESTTLISPEPKKKLREYAVFTSFTYEVWIFLVLTTILIGPIVKMVVWLRKVLFGEINEEWEDLSDISFIMLRSLVMQVASYPPDGVVLRTLFMSWYFFCLLITSLYSDVMISMLAVPSFEKPIDSLWDLLDAIKERDYMTVISCGSNNEFIFSNTDQKIYSEIWKRFNRELGCIVTWDEGMDKVTTGRFALVNNRMGAEVRANLRGRKRFHFAKNEFYAHGYSIATPSGSPYRNAFQKVLSPLMWFGLVQKYTNDELMKAMKPNLGEEKGPEPISLQHLQAGFFMLLVGNIGGTASLIVEWLNHRYQKMD